MDEVLDDLFLVENPQFVDSRALQEHIEERILSAKFGNDLSCYEDHKHFLPMLFDACKLAVPQKSYDSRKQPKFFTNIIGMNQMFFYACNYDDVGYKVFILCVCFRTASLRAQATVRNIDEEDYQSGYLEYLSSSEAREVQREIVNKIEQTLRTLAMRIYSIQKRANLFEDDLEKIREGIKDTKLQEALYKTYEELGKSLVRISKQEF